MKKPVRTYGKITISGSAIIIEKAEPHICIKLKNIFDSINKTAVVPLEFSLTPENAADLDWFIMRFPLSISDKDKKKLQKTAKSYYDHINEVEKILLPDYVSASVLDLKPGFEARHYQVTGVDVVNKVKRILIGDDLGLGKTLIGILTCLQPGALPAMVVVQSHLMDQWAQQIEKFTSLRVHKIKVTKAYSVFTILYLVNH